MFFWGFLKSRNAMIFIAGLQIFIILALRAEDLGVDLDKYKEAYYYYQNYSLIEILKSLRIFSYANIPIGVESGYVLLNWILGSLGVSFHSFLILHAFFCVLSLCLFVKNFSRIPWLSFSIVIAIGMYSYMFCILRQAIAVAILYQTISLINQRKICKFLILVFLASLFHVIAILFLPLYWLGNLKIDVKNFSIAILLSCFVGLLVPFIYGLIFTRFFSELNKDYSISTSFQYNNMFVFMLFIVLFLFIFFKKDLEIEKKDSVLLWGSLLAIPVQSMSFYLPVFSRAAIGIFLPLIAILIPNIIEKNDDLKNKIFPKIFIYFVFFCYFMITFNNGGLQIIPYRFY